MKALISIILVVAVLGGGGYYYARYLHAESANNFRTAKVERGEMLPTIGATGTIEPEEVVDIGAQVTGIVTKLNADYGSNVEANQVLAQIDPTKYAATRDQAAAQVASANASLALAKANVANADAVVRRDNDLRKTTKGALADSQYDLDTAADGVANAQVGVAQAGIKQAEATLKSAETDLGYTKITSPVKGVIIDRRVNVGQTQVSALNASSIFLLAKDLSRVEIWASVNEADIGRIHKGQKATFTVDTFPGETFVGTVSMVRLNATMTQNVVTYTVVVTTENKDMRLYPYMTANVNFEVERHDDVLKVPNAALRWKPRPAQIAPDVREKALSDMNRKGDKSKSKHADEEGASQEEGGTAADNQPASNPAAAKDTAASPGAKPASSATGTRPDDWKARAEKHAHHKDKPDDATAKAGGNAPQGKNPPTDQAQKLATAQNGAPGTPVSDKDLAKKKEHYESGFIWAVDGNFVRPIKVKIIATDGTMTEVRQARDKNAKDQAAKQQDAKEGDGKEQEAPAIELRADLDIVTGENVASGDDDTTNPFMPKLFRGGGGSNGKK